MQFFFSIEIETSLEELWGYVSQYAPKVDEFYKGIVWTWFSRRRQDFRVLVDGEDVSLCLFLVIESAHTNRICVDP